MANPHPLWQEVLFALMVPPIMAMLFAVLARGWAGAVAGVLGRRVSETTRKEQAWEFWLVLWGTYAAELGMFVYFRILR
ncbi:MAG TPA: hypothetical protein VNJ52_00100 [Patescibacteria group bacterium]|nr:hypothetical protein [Patescibacteria group bacterium]